MNIKVIAVSKSDSVHLSQGFIPFPVTHRIARSYYIQHSESRITSEQREKITQALVNNVLYDTVYLTQYGEYGGNRDIIERSPQVLEVGYLPGITDNVANVAGEIICSICDFDPARIKVHTSLIYILNDSKTPEQLKLIEQSIHNPVVHKLLSMSGPDYINNMHKKSYWNTITATPHIPRTVYMDLNVDDDELSRISELGIAGHDGKRRGKLGLSLNDMRKIAAHYRNREISDIELETIAQTWSEHCKHRIFNAPLDDIHEGIFNRFIRGATNKITEKKQGFCVSVFSDNAGAITFDDTTLITHKVETHNSPSAIEPYGGAITGILGVNRDCLGFGLGARPIANTYAFCFAPYTDDTREIYHDPQLARPILDARKIINDVISGIEAGGNCSGIPTTHGLVYYDRSYRGKPLVYAGTIGMMPRDINGKPSHIKRVHDNDLIVILGGSIGKDGIHGATLSSAACDEHNNISMVQIGDPYLQKKVTEAIIELRDSELFNAVTDNGAGGLSSSVGELGYRGFTVNLEKAELKNKYMDPWEIWISESQERMTLAVPEDKIEELIKITDLHEVNAYIIGRFNNSGVGIVKYNNEIIMEQDLDFLHNGYYRERLHSTPTITEKRADHIKSKDIAGDILKILSSPNICSREPIIRGYDHEVQGTSAMKPLINDICTDAAVIRPFYDKVRGIAISSAMLPGYSAPIPDDCYFDTYNMAACAIDTAIRNLTAVGADPEKIALLDNFCWRDSKNPKSLWQLKRAAQACYDYAVAYNAPFISGKDSMFNDFTGYDKNGRQISVSATPTLLISSIGIIENINKLISMDFKRNGDIIYLVGETHDELGGSEYYKLHNIYNTKVPAVNAKNASGIYERFFYATQHDLIASAISPGIGGLAVGLAKSVMSSGSLGCDIDLSKVITTADCMTTVLFSETQSRLLISVNPKREKEFSRIFSKVACSRIGTVTDNSRVTFNNEISLTIRDMLNAYKTNNLCVK